MKIVNLNILKKYRRRKGIYVIGNQKIEKLRNIQKNKCFYCEIELTNMYSIDHFIPVCKNGSDEIENIVITCRKCNYTKWRYLPEQFMLRFWNKIIEFGSINYY